MVACPELEELVSILEDTDLIFRSLDGKARHRQQ